MGNHDKIFAAAIACFDEFGVRRTTMEDVARRAGVSRKTVYNRFANKSALLGQVIAMEGADVCARAQAKLDLSLPAAELIVQAELALLDAARRSPFVDMLIGPEAMSVSAAVVDHSARVAKVQRAYWLPILEPLRAAGRLRVADLDEVVDWLTFVHVVLVARPSTFENAKRTREMLLRYVTPALVAEAGGRRATPRKKSRRSARR